jgi:hypothetical protein
MCAFDDLEGKIKGFTGDFEAKKQEFLKLLGECRKSPRRKNPLPTLERVKELLDYQSISGEFVWRVSPNRNIVPGTRAGGISRDGYRLITIDGIMIRAHRLVWFYNYGTWPQNGMDHVNGQRLDNRLENLRDSTGSVSSFNRGRLTNNTSGIVGVFWETSRNKWRACISVGGKKINLGSYSNVRDAQAARAKAERKYFPGIKRWAA